MKNGCALMLIVLGVVSVILGLVMFGMEDGYYEMDEQYGGDAYTGIQNAAAQTADNVKALGKIVKTGFGGVFAIGGLIMITIGVNGTHAQTAGVTYEEWTLENQEKNSMGQEKDKTIY